jgi:hypothetical protein
VHSIRRHTNILYGSVIHQAAAQRVSTSCRHFNYQLDCASLFDGVGLQEAVMDHYSCLWLVLDLLPLLESVELMAA